jgi:hypothetical protein
MLERDRSEMLRGAERLERDREACEMNVSTRR